MVCSPDPMSVASPLTETLLKAVRKEADVYLVPPEELQSVVREALLLTERELYTFLLDVLKTARVFADKGAPEVSQHMLAIVEPLGDRLHQMARGEEDATQRADDVRKSIQTERSALASQRAAAGVEKPVSKGVSMRPGPGGAKKS